MGHHFVNLVGVSGQVVAIQVTSSSARFFQRTRFEAHELAEPYLEMVREDGNLVHQALVRQFVHSHSHAP